MRNIFQNIFRLSAFLCLLNSCITPYDPRIGKAASEKIVVSGLVTDVEGVQTVYISLSSSISNPKYIPLSNCVVNILDDKGNSFLLTESNKGQYDVWMDKQYLNPGTSYQVHAMLPSNVEIYSDFEKMPFCPEVDSIYYLRKDMTTTNPLDTMKGIQFYLDFDGKSVDTRFFRWELEETYEHHVDYPVILVYDGSSHKISPPDNSKRICWNTNNIPGVYTLSTLNLQQNKYLMLPLHFIDNHSIKFVYGYSLLVKQFALTENAYTYWEDVRINSDKQGGLYGKQPLSIIGNLHNKTQSDNSVLGFFTASSVKSKRIFINEIKNLKFEITPECQPVYCWRGFNDIDPSTYPQPYVILPATRIDRPAGIYTLDKWCVDCTYSGGKTLKPDFWPTQK